MAISEMDGKIMINWLIKFIMSNSNIGVAATQELAKHRLHTTKYDDLCMYKEYHLNLKIVVI